jgi:hypothetical protein
MYVKIIKGNGWYNSFVGAIFEVRLDTSTENFYILLVDNTENNSVTRFIHKKHCEVINLDTFEGKISEEFAAKLLDFVQIHLDEKGDIDRCKTEKDTFDTWKQEGFITQSREDELRIEIERCKLIEKYKNDPHYKHFYEKAIELIQILDNKQKGKKL